MLARSLPFILHWLVAGRYRLVSDSSDFVNVGPPIASLMAPSQDPPVQSRERSDRSVWSSPLHDEVMGNTQPGLTIWFTGLSSAGKSTLSRTIFDLLSAEGYEAEMLDGDLVRRELCKDLGFSKEDRDENIRRIGFVADLLCRHGVVVLVSAISPYRAVRDEIRQRIGRFLEVYVDAPLAICERRDVKGLYRRARSGELQHFTGIDDPYEPPLHPEIVCHTDKETVEQSAEKVLACIRTYCCSERDAQRAFQHQGSQY